MKLALSLFSMMLSLMSVGCTKSPKIMLVVGEHADGLVVFKESEDGLNLKDGMKIELDDEKVVKVKNFKIFDRLVEVQASTSSGKVFEQYGYNYHKINDYGFWVLRAPAWNERYFFIGKREDAKELIDDMGLYIDGPHPGLDLSEE